MVASAPSQPHSETPEPVRLHLSPNSWVPGGTALVVQWLRIRLPMQGMKVRSLVRELRSHVCYNEDPAQPTLPPKKRVGSQAHRASHLASETPAPAKPHPQRSAFPPHGAAPLNSCVCVSVCLSACVSVCVLVTQACLTLCGPMRTAGYQSSVRGILQARILEWVVIPFSRGSFQPRDPTRVFPIAGGFLMCEPPGKPEPS